MTTQPTETSETQAVRMTDNNRIDESLSAEHHLIIGYTGSGKTQFIKRHPFFCQSKKVLAWDPEGSFDDLPEYTTIKGLAMALRRVRKYGNFHGRFVPGDVTPQVFEQFCELAWHCGHALNPMTIVAEELADVVKSGVASKYWGFLSRKGRKYGIRILGVSQRPQEVDKTFLNQCPIKWCGQLGSDNDRKYMANIMDLKKEQLACLPDVHFYLRQGSKEPKMGRLTFSN